MRAGAVQPATWDVLTQDNGGHSVVLNPLVACWEQASVCPPLTTDTLSQLNNWILTPRKVTPFSLHPWPHVGLTETLPGLTYFPERESESLFTTKHEEWNDTHFYYPLHGWWKQWINHLHRKERPEKATGKERSVWKICLKSLFIPLS